MAIAAIAAPAQNMARLQQGDFVAICGDSITEERIYSVYIQDYLLMCQPANCDGVGLITFLDFSIVASEWKENDVALLGDINGDDVVDFNDLEIVAYHWLSDCSEE